MRLYRFRFLKRSGFFFEGEGVGEGGLVVDVLKMWIFFSLRISLVCAGGRTCDVKSEGRLV